MWSEYFLSFFKIFDIIKAEASYACLVKSFPELAASSADMKSSSSAIFPDEIDIMLEIRQ